MKKIDITVLLVDSIPARIYLALLKKEGFYASEVLLLDVQPQSSKYQSIERVFGSWIARKVLNVVVHLKSYRNVAIDRSLANILLSEFGLTYRDTQLDQVFSGLEKVKKLSISGLNDPILHNKIESGTVKTFLFTGGGILGESILSIPGVKIIHIHPGIVPEVKGADGFYWSYLLRKKAGYSVFYMNSGIDTGDIVHQKEFDIPFSNDVLSGFSNNCIYRTILEFYDPCLRILTLIDLLKLNVAANPQSTELDLSKLANKKQDPDAGRTYFFMHEKLREFVINKLKGKC